MAKKLKKWRVYGTVVGGKYLGEFEAATKEEAEQMAMESDAAGISLCHQCTDECEDPHVDEARAEEVK
jgi:hypothetical protein